LQGRVFVGTGAATVDDVVAFPLAVEAEPVRKVTVLEEAEEGVDVALPTIGPVPVSAVVAKVMVDENVWYVPVAVAALGALVPVKMVRAGSFVEIVGADWPCAMLMLSARSARQTPKRLRDPIARRRSTASHRQRKQLPEWKWNAFGIHAIAKG
jgi:hypothetical protein